MHRLASKSAKIYNTGKAIVPFINPLFCEVFTGQHRCGLYKVPAVVIFKKSQCRYISALFAIQTLKSFKNSKQTRTKMWLIVFHSGAVNQKILFHSPRKFQEIPMGIFGQMKSAPMLSLTRKKPPIISEGFIPLLNCRNSFLPAGVTNLTLGMAKLQTCWSSTIISVLLISFEVDVPTGKVGGSLLFECRRCKQDPSICFNFLHFHQKVNTFKKLLKCTFTYTQTFEPDVLQLSFLGSFHYFKPVSCWILFCQNVTGIPQPFDQLHVPPRVGKVTTFKTPEISISTQTFEEDVSQLFLLDIFLILSFLSKLRVKQEAVGSLYSCAS